MRVFPFMGLVALACVSQTSDGSDSEITINLDSIVVKEIAFLDSSGATVDKSVTFDGEIQQRSFNPTRSVWEQELSLFKTINLVNQPIYRHGFAITSAADSASNLTVERVSALGDCPIQFIHLYRTPQGELRKVESLYRADHQIYRQEEYMALEFEPILGALHLTAYSLAGWQRTILSDSSTYSIKARITYPGISEPGLTRIN